MDSKDYEKALETLYKKLPEKAKKHERFKVPTAESFVEGKKTYVKNVNALVKEIGRPEKHLIKYFTKETAVPVSSDGNRLIISGKFYNDQVNKIISNYFEAFVLCPECGKPDTKSEDRGHVKMMRCEACGALSPVKHI